MIDPISAFPAPQWEPGAGPLPDADALASARQEMALTALRHDRDRIAQMLALTDGFAPTEIFDAFGRGFIVLAKTPRGSDDESFVCDFGFQIHVTETGWFPCAGYVLAYDGSNLYGRFMPTLDGTELSDITDEIPLDGGDRYVWLGIRGTPGEGEGTLSGSTLTPFTVTEVLVEVTGDEPPSDGSAGYDFVVPWAKIHADRSIEPTYYIQGHFAFVAYPPGGSSSGQSGSAIDGAGSMSSKASQSDSGDGDESSIPSETADSTDSKMAIVPVTGEDGVTRYFRWHCVESRTVEFVDFIDVEVPTDEIDSTIQIPLDPILLGCIEPETLRVVGTVCLGLPMMVTAEPERLGCGPIFLRVSVRQLLVTTKRTAVVRIHVRAVRRGFLNARTEATYEEYLANKKFWSTPARWAGLPNQAPASYTP